MTSHAVIAHGVRKQYRQRVAWRRHRTVTAVDELNLQIRSGEVYALLGPNGAGKTTTVEILTGYRRRDAGEVRVLRTDPQTAPLAWRRQLGIVLQQNRDIQELTVAETVRHFAGYYPAPRDPGEVIARVGLTAQTGQRLRSLSGGQRRRVDVAIGIVGRPRLLFLDEPTTGFDPQARRGFWELIRTLAGDDATTVVLTTHYLEEAEALADRVGVIQAGRLVAEGAPQTLGGRGTRATVTWRDPAGPRTAQVVDPAALVCELAARYGGTIPDLTVRRPTLEDVYVELLERGPA